MNNKRFIEIKDQFYKHCDKTLVKKETEYSGDEDRLWNFKVAATILTHWLQAKKTKVVTVAEVAFIFGLKHEVSIMKILADGEAMPTDVLDEKFGDKANYNVFSYADLIEQAVSELKDGVSLNEN